MSSYDVLTIGDAKLDTFLTLNDAHGKVRLDEKSGELCFKHGEKIIVDHTYFSLGGNAANVAVGLTRLGLRTAIAAGIGDDEFALKIVNILAREQIDRAFLRQAHGQNSSVSIIINFKGDRTIFSEHVPRQHNFHYMDADIKWLYLTSLGEEWKDAYEKALHYVTTKHASLAFNPGTRQLAEHFPVIKDALALTTILYVNKEEAQLLVKEYSHHTPSGDIKELLYQTQALGPKTIVITNGKEGAYALEDTTTHYQPIIPTPIIERTGAGDSYSSGSLAAIVHGHSLKEALLWGTLNAASLVSHVGTQTGLLKKSQMDEKIKQL